MALAAQQPVHGSAHRPPSTSGSSALQLLAAHDFPSRARELGVEVGERHTSGRLVCDLSAYSVTRDGEELDLSPRQVELLALFLAAPRKVWSREQLEWVCWGDSSGSRRVDVQLCRLRARAGLDLLRNVRDRGWSLRISA